MISKLEKTIPGYEISSWETNFPELKAALATKGKAMDVFGFIIILVAGIGIMNLLMMAVYERTREIGLLGAMGLKPRQISLLFIFEGSMIGLVRFYCRFSHRNRPECPEWAPSDLISRPTRPSRIMQP